jgi:cullin 1
VSLGLNKEKPKETTLDVYKANFEDDFLIATEVYYTAESTHFIAVNTVADYMKKVETRLAEELGRVRQYLHPSTETEVSPLIILCEVLILHNYS